MRCIKVALTFIGIGLFQLHGQTFLKHQTLPVPETEQFEGTVVLSGYYIAQFSNLPNDFVKSRLQNLGCEVMGYLPKNSFIVFLSNALPFSSLSEFGVRGMHAFRNTWKYDSELFSGEIPPHARRSDGNVGIWIHPFPHAGKPNWTDSLLKMGIISTHSISYTNVLEAWIPTAQFGPANIPAWVQYLSFIPEPGEPENLQGTANHRVAWMQNPNVSTTLLSGNGVRLLLNDDGLVSPHIDFHNRITNLVTTNNGSHGDHCAGIIAGAGNLEPVARGNAPGADLRVSLYTHSGSSNLGFFSYPSAYVQDSLVVSSNSFGNGCNTGYNSLAQYLDQTVRTHTGLSHVFSAGNSGTSNCSYGAGSGWGNITGGTKIGKNVLAVGNLTKANALSNSSSRGPADDGRLKPNLCAVGNSVYSTYENASQYSFASGTSMACPAVTGVMGLLHEGYRGLNGGEMAPSELLHALLMNTADDLGNPGPDFRFGYGRVNAKAAWEAMSSQWYLNDTLVHNATSSYTLNVPAGLANLRVMLYWHDEPAQIQAARALVNDLDLALLTPAGDTIRPWVLNPMPIADSLNAPARRNRDSLNNMEQVTWANPAPGAYTMLVNGFSIPVGPQSFHLTWFFDPPKLEWAYPSGGESFVPGTQERLYWDYSGPPGSFAIHYTTDGGQNWTAINTNVNANSRDLLFTVPAFLQSEFATFRIVRGGFSDTTLVPVSILQVPQNLHTDTVCPYSVQLLWDPVPGADAYDVFMLGNRYMDSIATTTLTQFTVAPVSSSGDLWFAVRARTNQGITGRRCRAIRVQPGSGPCDPVYDLAIAAPVFPFVPETPACFLGLPLQILLKNRSFVGFSGFSIHVSINGAPPVSFPFSGSLPWLQDTLLTLPINFPQTTAQPIHVKIWHNDSTDNVPTNDTLEYQFNWSASSAVTLPFINDFESMNTCVPADCGASACIPGQGFVNVTMADDEHADWTVIQAPGPNAQPFTDYNPGMPGGQFAQIAAGNCENVWAHLHSPCVDLANAVRPYLKFAWYIPPGNDAAEIHVDVFSQGTWTRDILSPLANPSQNWQVSQVSLEAFAGQTVMVRFRAFSGIGSSGGPAVDAIEIRGIQAGFTMADSLCSNVPVLVPNGSDGFIDSIYWDFGATAVPPNQYAIGDPTVTFTQPGTYPVTQTVYGHDTIIQAVHSVVVEEVPQPQIQVSLIQSQTGTYQLTAIPGGSGTFTWTFSNGITKHGNPIVHTVDSLTGQLVVTLVHTNLCGTDYAVANLSPVSIESLKELIRLYPNPSGSGSEVRLALPIGLSNATVVLSDAAGRLLWQTAPLVGNADVLLPKGLPQGLYYVRIRWENGMHTLPWMRVGD